MFYMFQTIPKFNQSYSTVGQLLKDKGLTAGGDENVFSLHRNHTPNHYFKVGTLTISLRESKTNVDDDLIWL